ncbi:hypothetical protein FQR65_LT20672 [Abscondita terminalis]|nr:hypothetical protein FQR65_LT20672 [Abscondita terminalis]
MVSQKSAHTLPGARDYGPAAWPKPVHVAARSGRGLVACSVQSRAPGGQGWMPWKFPEHSLKSAISRVEPSGAARATNSEPTRLPAPGLFSTTTGWPRAWPSSTERARATRSVLPPAGKGTITRTGRSGKAACAQACSMIRPRPARDVPRAVFMASPVSAVLAQHVPGDVELVDLAGAFVQAEQAHIAEVALDGAEVGHVAGAAEHLHGAVGHAAAHFRGEVLAHGGGQCHVLAAVAGAGGFQDHRAGREDLGAAVGQQGLHQLEVRHGCAELAAPAHVLQRQLQHAHGRARAQRGQVQALLIEHLQHGLEALAFASADDLVGRHAAAVEMHVGDGRAGLAHLAVGLAGGQARRTLHEEGRESLAARAALLRAGDDGEHIGQRCVGDEALGAVQHVVVALAARRGLDVARLRARVRLGQRQAARELAARHAWQPALLLVLGAVGHQGFRADAGVGAQHQFLGAQAQAAVGLGNAPAEVALVAQLLDHGGRDVVVALDLSFQRMPAVAHEMADVCNQGLQAGVVLDHGPHSDPGARAQSRRDPRTDRPPPPRLAGCVQHPRAEPLFRGHAGQGADDPAVLRQRPAPACQQRAGTAPGPAPAHGVAAVPQPADHGLPGP